MKWIIKIIWATYTAVVIFLLHKSGVVRQHQDLFLGIFFSIPLMFELTGWLEKRSKKRDSNVK